MAENKNYHGVSESYERSLGQVTSEYLPDLMGSKGIRTMEAMLNDATYGAIVFVVTSIFRSLEWEVSVPEGGDTDPDLMRKRDYLEHALFYDLGDPNDLDSQASFDDLVQMAVTSFWWGYSLVYPQIRRRKDGLHGIGRLIQISPNTIKDWVINEPLGNVTGVVQQNPTTFVETTIPREEYLHFKTLPASGSPEGRSFFRSSYKSWYRREKLQTTESILAERGTGFPVVIADKKFKEDAANGDKASAAIVQQLEALPSQVRQNSRSGVCIWTDNYRDSDGKMTNVPRIKFEFAPVGKSNNVDFRAAIRDYDMAIVRSVMAQFLFNGSGDTGSRAMDESQTSTFMQSINGMAEIIAGVINRQMVSRLWKLNGWQDDEMRPFVRHNGTDKDNLHQLGSYIQSLSAAGAAIFPNQDVQNYLLSLAGIPTETYDDPDEL